MKPIPVDFHIGSLQVHTYGIGLALTFWFAFTYFERRLRKNGYRTDWWVSVFLWILLAAVVGARVLHVLSNLSSYSGHLGEVFAIWHGGLSSFGGLLFAVPTGIFLFRRRCPELPIGRALDLVAPVLMAAWAMGRLLGPQLMVAGGGHPTHQWFGMYYSGQVGRRLPVPLFQAAEDFGVYLVLIAIERRLSHWSDGSARWATRRARSSAPPWCSGGSSAPSMSISGWARTATSGRCWSRLPASCWSSGGSWSCCGPAAGGRSGARSTVRARRRRRRRLCRPRSWASRLMRRPGASAPTAQ